jgi:hypothetical protein
MKARWNRLISIFGVAVMLTTSSGLVALADGVEETTDNKEESTGDSKGTGDKEETADNSKDTGDKEETADNSKDTDDKEETTDNSKDTGDKEETTGDSTDTDDNEDEEIRGATDLTFDETTGNLSFTNNNSVDVRWIADVSSSASSQHKGQNAVLEAGGKVDDMNVSQYFNGDATYTFVVYFFPSNTNINEVVQHPLSESNGKPSNTVTYEYKNNSSSQDVSSDDSNSASSGTEEESSSSTSTSEATTPQPTIGNSTGWDSLANAVDKAITDAVANAATTATTTAVVNIKLNGVDTVPATAINAIAGKDVVLSLSVDTNTLVTIDGGQLTAADVSDVKLVSGKSTDGNTTLNVRAGNANVEKSIVVYSKIGADKVGKEVSLYFVNADQSLVEFRTSPVYENGYAAFNIPLVGANYKIAVK